jgi:pimeloyl-ACP methyl ester carboxylesterase
MVAVSPMRTAQSLAHLAYWLGPWSAGSEEPGRSTLGKIPENVVRRRITLGPTEGYELERTQGRTIGTYVVLPGLHYAGPDDPRLDRFCRVLAASGFLVVAPFIRSFSSLELSPSGFDDARAAFAHAAEEATRRGHASPAVFSISFGSRLAVELGRAQKPPSALLLFGGYAEFATTVRFAVTGKRHRHERSASRHDPLNAPVVFKNFLPELPVREKERLGAAWTRMVHDTWGKMDLKEGERRRPAADAIARTLAPELRSDFYRGCCLEEGWEEWLEHGLEHGATRLSFLDGRKALREVRCPTYVVHGRDDDVIPYSESEKTVGLLPRGARRALHLTGLYGHTGTTRVPLADAARETAVMAQILVTLARAPR